MRRLLRSAPPLLFVVATATSSPAWAQSLELSASLGLTDCTDEYCEDGTLVFEETSPGVGVLASGWVRVHRLVSLGLGLHGSFIAVDDQPGVDTTLTFLNLDGGARVHVPVDAPIDPFAGLTFGWSWVSADYDGDLDRGTGTLSGPTAAIHLGAEWIASPELSIGALFKYYLPFWSDYCYDSRELGDDCDDPEDSWNEDDLPDVWYFGASMTWHQPA
jgi:hypothetical protein